MRLRYVRELDSLLFSLLEASRTTLDNELGSDGSHGQVGGDAGLFFGPQLGGVSFHLSDKDARRLEVDFMGMRPEKVLLLLLSLWTVCMGGIEGGTAHSVSLGDTIGGVFIGPFRGLDFLALLRP